MTSDEAEPIARMWDALVIEIGYKLSDDNLNQITDNLRRYATHAQARCYVAVVGTQIVGFVTCAVTLHPIESGYLGHVEELYVQPDFRRSGIAAALVEAAVIWLKAQGVGAIFTRIDKTDEAWVAFWEAQQWEQDMIIYAIYSNPGDDAAQAVWDRYQ